METTLIYFSVKAVSATYILYKVWMFIFSPRVYNFWDSQLRHMRIVNPEKPDVPLNKNDAFQKVQKRRVQEKR